MVNCFEEVVVRARKSTPRAPRGLASRALAHRTKSKRPRPLVSLMRAVDPTGRRPRLMSVRPRSFRSRPSHQDHPVFADRNLLRPIEQCLLLLHLGKQICEEAIHPRNRRMNPETADPQADFLGPPFSTFISHPVFYAREKRVAEERLLETECCLVGIQHHV